MKIEILDLGINNLGSMVRSFENNSQEFDQVCVVSGPIGTKDADLIVLPGLGHFRAGMRALEESGLSNYVKERFEQNTKIVGICLGMQMLFECSEEAPGRPGLRFLEGVVKFLPSSQSVPNIGWDMVNLKSNSGSFPSLESGKDFYFDHSLCVTEIPDEVILTETPFGESNFISSVLNQNILGFQFHPEKSGKIGQSLVGDILDWARSSD